MFIRDRVILPPELLVKLHFDSPVLQTVPTFRARKPETGYTALGLQGGQIRASKWANSEYRTHFYLASNEGRYSEAEQMLSEDAKRAIKGDLGQLAGGFKSICDKNTRDGTITRVDIQKEEVRGEGATVVVKISFKDGTSKD